ncbi:hypothetical protein BGZ94_008048 [Podila epigama]|nr:hypothetical protein BGZ94_008048 [Podila epigama]
MRFSNALSLCLMTLLTMNTSSIQASPILSPSGQEAAALVKHDKRALDFNDWSCRPSAEHPRPVILVHGLYSSAIFNWLYMQARFKAKDYCVFALNYGQLSNFPLIYGLDKIENSAQQFSAFVNKVLSATGADKVDLMGHSLGSIMPRYYLKFLGGGPKVHKFVGIGAIQYGTTFLGLVPILSSLGLYDPTNKIVDAGCLSCFQVLVDSPFIRNLNQGGDTVPGVEYLMITSK